MRTSWLGGRGSGSCSTESRKVRTSQSRVIANSNPRRLAGKCHRKQTATFAVVRVKRCGKSAPASRVTGVARQTPPEARSRRPHRKVRPRRRLRVARPSLRVGRLRHPATVCPDGWSPPYRRCLRRGGGEQNPAYRPTRPPHVWDQRDQLVAGFPVRSPYAVDPSTESIASRVRSSESGHSWL